MTFSRLNHSVLFLSTIAAAFTIACAQAGEIDREALVNRHNPVIQKVDYDAPLTVGNGGFAFTVDVTGLQTWPARYQENGVPTETLSRWAWVNDANPDGYKLSDANVDFRHPDGTVQGYPTDSKSSAGQWLRRNPRIHSLGQIALVWNKPDGSEFVPQDVKDIEQTLQLWRGTIRSRYSLGGKSVTITTACLPNQDTVVLRLESDLLTTRALGVKLAFPRGYNLAVPHTPGYDWSHPESHLTELTDRGEILRRVNGLDYFVSVTEPVEKAPAPHTFLVHAKPGQRTLELAVHFGKNRCSPAQPDFRRIQEHWSQFWQASAAADFSGSSNPLASKLEQRIVLSQYLTAVQLAGDVPPQESGLTCSTWYGKHHTEMIWWHAAHFSLWGHPELLARNLDWYVARLPQARDIASARGLNGARWAKMVGPELRESPGGNPLIVWNQPHAIYLAELIYRSAPSTATLERYAQLVQDTAACMASMLWLDPKRNQYVLGPPLWIAQEIYDQRTSQNPAFELAYWRWTLQLAQSWRQRRGLPPEKSWDHIIARLAPLPQKDGKYVATESHPDTWDNIDSRHDHPSMLMALGVIPQTSFVDRATMNRTLDAVLAHWDWKTKIWGWDYPMIAMTATRLGRPEIAVEVLLRDGPNNLYLPNGHCPQRANAPSKTYLEPGKPRYDIGVYLPANGSFLSAVSLMLAGWDGAPQERPGLPSDGSWIVKAEGWKSLP